MKVVAALSALFLAAPLALADEGTIKSYDFVQGKGVIVANDSGEKLPFGKASVNADSFSTVGTPRPDDEVRYDRAGTLADPVAEGVVFVSRPSLPRKGTISKWSAKAGVGRIRPDGMKTDIPVKASDVRKDALRKLKPGQRVVFKTTSSRPKKAVDVAVEVLSRRRKGL